jgi:hypothetical protein
MKKLLLCGLWSLLRLAADSVRIPYLMASQLPSPGTKSSSSTTSGEPQRRMSGALIGLILIGAVAGVAGVGLWVLDQLASRTPTTEERAVPAAASPTPETPPSVPTVPASVPAPEPQTTPEEPEAAPEEPEAASRP